MHIRKLLRWIAKYLIVNKDPYEILENYEDSNQFLYKLGTQLLIDKNFPIQINIESSGTCNFECPFCARSSSSAETGKNSDLKTIEKIANEAKKHGPTVFAFHIWGEPLANPMWHDIAEIIKRTNPRNGTTITTNGSLLNSKNIKLLAKGHIDQIIISLHTLDPIKYNERIGVKFKLENTLKNIYSLAEATKNSKMIKIIRLFEAKNENVISENMYNELRGLGYTIEIAKYDNTAGYTGEWSEIKSPSKRHPCYHPWLTASITVNGDTTICCVDPENKLKIGNIKNTSIEEMWKGHTLQLIKKKHLKNDYTGVCSICDKCNTWSVKPDMFFEIQKK